MRSFIKIDSSDYLEAKKAFIKSYPIFCAFIPLGIGFGYMAHQLGIAWHLAMIMATLIYAGSAEFIIISMIAKFASIFDILIATTLCNLRHIFYGISVKQHYTLKGIRRFYMIHTLSDETYAILSAEKEVNHKFALYLSVLNHLYWVIGVFLGLSFGYYINIKIEGLEFILTALFIVLTIEQIYHIRKWEPFLYAILACSISLIIFSKAQMLFISMSLVTLLLIFRSTNYDDYKESI